MTIWLFVALVMRRHTTRPIELVHGARELAGVAIGGRAALLILATLAVLVVVAPPPTRDAFALGAALELIVLAFLAGA